MKAFIILLYLVGFDILFSIEATVNFKGKLKLYESKTIKSKVIIEIPNNEEITILDNSDKIESIKGLESIWYKVKYRNLIGWVFGEYIYFNTEQYPTIDCFNFPKLKVNHYIHVIGLNIILFKNGISFLNSEGLGSAINSTYGKWRIINNSIFINFKIKDTTSTNCLSICSEGEPYRNADIDNSKKFISIETYWKNCNTRCKKEGIKRYGKSKIEVLFDFKITKVKNKLIIKAIRVKEINPKSGKENYYNDELNYNSGDTSMFNCN